MFSENVTTIKFLKMSLFLAFKEEKTTICINPWQTVKIKDHVVFGAGFTLSFSVPAPAQIFLFCWNSFSNFLRFRILQKFYPGKEAG